MMTNLSLEAACALLITQQNEITRLNETLFDYETKFLNLRSVLKPFVSYPKDPVNVSEYVIVFVKEDDLRAARAAYRGEKE